MFARPLAPLMAGSIAAALAATLFACQPATVSAQAGGDMRGTVAAPEAAADIRDRAGTLVGGIYLRETPSGRVLATISLVDVPQGVHGAHLHETGDCSAPDFASAGDHIADGRAHGVHAPDGPHPGDLPNLVAHADGVVQAEFFLSHLSLIEHVFDADGAAFVLHADPDDHVTQPAGGSGERIACGVLERR